MGGRSGQSVAQFGSITITGGGSLTQDEKQELINHAKKEMRELGIKEDIEIRITPTANGLSGSVALSENMKKVNYITVSSINKSRMKSTISHELVHVEQVNNGRLFIKDGNIIFNGKKVMSVSTYRRKFSGKWTREKDQEYKKLPWESPAFNRENR